VILLLNVIDRGIAAIVGAVKDWGEVEVAGLPVAGHIGKLQHIGAANHLLNLAEAQLGHIFAQLFGDEEHEVDHMLGFAGEFLAKVGVLRGDADGAGIQVADAHHDAAGGDERSG